MEKLRQFLQLVRTMVELSRACASDKQPDVRPSYSSKLQSASMTWASFFEQHKLEGKSLFSAEFIARWGNEKWDPNDEDRQAAEKLHVQLTSRIVTQKLGYLDGVEKTALNSVYALFQETREILDGLPHARHFDALAWNILNHRVRPFTAKWHRQSEQGALAALDATDEFRAQLTALQPVLRKFDDLLLHIRDNRTPPELNTAALPPNPILDEMRTDLPWGIHEKFGGVTEESARKINRAEKLAILARRDFYKLPPETPHAAGLAISGGGIRSATFSLGVLIALAGRGLLPRFDYVSTVSGGGYLGSFLSAFLQSPKSGLKAEDLPFQRDEGEAAALRHIRHHSKYLTTGSPWQKTKMAMAHVLGMALNITAVSWVLVVAAAAELWLRSFKNAAEVRSELGVYLAFAVVGGAVLSLLALRLRVLKIADALIAIPALLLLLFLLWQALGLAHYWFKNFTPQGWSKYVGKEAWIIISGVVTLLGPALSGVLKSQRKRLVTLLMMLSLFAAPVFLFGLYLSIYHWAGATTDTFLSDKRAELGWIILIGAILYFFVFDINFTSFHRHYRNQLGDAYLIQPKPGAKQEDPDPFLRNVSLKMSRLGAERKAAPYHLLNCALNVPASKNTRMQGRFTDFFLFSPAYCGSPLIGYQETSLWEKADSHLDLGTAMAISGAAVAPQMGLATKRQFSFWLSLLNVRLGYWLRRPDERSWLGTCPGLGYLLREMLGLVDENRPWINVSDGGHIENLGVYELLRRRCKFIVAIDGEQDSNMTFHALTTLQRLAAIDLGIRIDINLDDLRLNEQRLSRSHFRFCRVRYPKFPRGSEEEFGYLLYVKLSLTGNEGEFIRRYRLDEPAFPHQSTADQFFTEAQFEAYRSLGEHVGDKLFLRALVGELAESKSIRVEQWFQELGKNLLEPLPIRS